MEWNETEISVWNTEDARMKWNRRFQEWNGRQSSILPYQFNTRFCALYVCTEKYIPMSGGVNNIVTDVFNFNINAYYLSTNCGTLVAYVAQTVHVLHHSKYIAIYSVDLIVGDFDRFDLFSVVFFFLRSTICQVLNFVFLHRHENSYLLFHSRFSLILFIFLVFQLNNNPVWCYSLVFLLR